MTYAFGDSIMKGILTDFSQFDEGKVNFTISDRSFINLLNIPIRNFARYGSTTPDGQRLVERHHKEILPGDYVLFEFGGNDSNFDWKSIAECPEGYYEPAVTLQQFQSTYENMIHTVQQIGAQPLLLSLPAILPKQFFDYVSAGIDKKNIMQWLGGDVNTIANWHEQYNLEIFKLSTRCQVPVIDISTPFFERRDIDNYFCADGIHPNEKGHELIAQTIHQASHSFIPNPMANC